MTFAKILIMTIIVSAFLFTLYKFVITLRDYIKAKKNKNINACSDEVSNLNENNKKEVS